MPHDFETINSDLGPSNKMLGIDFKEVVQHNRRVAEVYDSFYPVRGRLHVEIVVYNPTIYVPRTCDVCVDYAGIKCKDGVVRCVKCRARYARRFRMKRYIRRTLE